MRDRWQTHREQCAKLSRLEGGFLCDLLRERDQLLAALRELAIVDIGGGGSECRVCRAQWPHYDGESHRKGCLAAIDQGQVTVADIAAAERLIAGDAG